MRVDKPQYVVVKRDPETQEILSFESSFPVSDLDYVKDFAAFLRKETEENYVALRIHYTFEEV